MQQIGQPDHYHCLQGGNEYCILARMGGPSLSLPLFEIDQSPECDHSVANCCEAIGNWEIVALVALVAMGIGQPLHSKTLALPAASSDNSININMNVNANKK